jgi:hypothetical protein
VAQSCDNARGRFLKEPKSFRHGYNTHAATAKLLEDAVVGDILTDRRVGTRHGDAILGLRP